VVKRGHLGGIPEMPLLPLRGYSVSGVYVCMYVFFIHIGNFRFFVPSKLWI
jgi:hypothetical protein